MNAKVQVKLSDAEVLVDARLGLIVVRRGGKEQVAYAMDDLPRDVRAELEDAAGRDTTLLYALGAVDPAWFLNRFVDVRYVMRLVGDVLRLEAVEVLPCYGSPECRWERIEEDGSALTEYLLDAIADLVSNAACK